MRLILSLIVLLVVVPGAGAQPLNAPTYSVGDTWTVKSGDQPREIKVLNVGGGTVEMRGFLAGCSSCVYQLDQNLTILAVQDEAGKPADATRIGFLPIGSGWQLYSFPLELKKKWDINAEAFLQGRNENLEVSSRVVKIEEVKTPAGTFKAYRIDRDWVLKGGRAQLRHNDFRWQTTTWYAPDVKLFVKTTTTNPRGQNRELISYS